MEFTIGVEADMAGEVEGERCVRSLYERLQKVRDRRGQRGRRYEAATALTLLTLAKMAGEKTVSGVAHWVRLRGEWLQEVLPLRDQRLPCGNTYQYICDRVDMATFAAEVEAFQEEVLAARRASCCAEASQEDSEWQQLVVDGKVLRGSDRQALPAQAARMVLNAYHVQQRRVWKQMEIQGRGGEARAALTLVRLSNLSGFVVSADALHTRPAWCRQVRQAGGHYLLIAKTNRRELYEDIACLFEAGPFPDLPEGTASTLNKGHGRLEHRTLRISAALSDYLKPGWPDVAQVFQIERTIDCRGLTRCERVYGLTSLHANAASPTQVLRLVRQHWHIENILHHRRDVTLGEDDCQVCRGQTPFVLAQINSLVLFLIDQTGATNAAAKIREFAAHPQRALDLLLHPP
jgi:predicted transposase YbfD/YdcC